MVDEVFVRCPSCGARLSVRIGLAAEPPHVHVDRGVDEELPSEAGKPAAGVEIDGVDWKPWRSGRGEWISMLNALQLFQEIQKAGGQLEKNGYRYWVYGRNRDLIARQRIGR